MSSTAVEIFAALATVARPRIRRQGLSAYASRCSTRSPRLTISIVVTQCGPADATSLLRYYICQQAHQNYDTGLASAATVVCVGVRFTLSMVSLKTLERGIHYET